ncbi:hypothetical protein [Rhizobium sp. K102]|uniref:AbiTii domain-containing protein n=1 Tax=Rhizobium sp. K102 TaxID=2918527 RepID=UPI001EFB1A58|nr:hypothetical protein [Rhizobium sp. K102]ULR43633.1 hypothetical protein MHI61_20990 [Rhizobium sp. K102]
MSGLVEEIQRDALNAGVPVTTILRKVKVAAAKLNLGAVEGWVEHELNGYPNNDLPPYRKLRGRPQAFNPYNGWIPIILSSDKQNETLAAVNLRQSLPSVEDLIAKSSAGFAEMHLPPSVIRSLNQGSDVELGRMSVHLSTTQLHGVVEAVRNAILDWALSLEKAGIKGEGFSFDTTERTKALTGSITYNINSIGSFNGIMGAENTAGDIVARSNDVEQILELTKQIRSSLPELGKAGAETPLLVEALNAIELEGKKPSPERSRLSSLLADARKAMVGAAGNLTAEGAMSLLSAGIKLLG